MQPPGWPPGSVGSLPALAAQQRLDWAVMRSRPLDTEEKTALITEFAVASGRPVDLVDLPCTVPKPWFRPLCSAAVPITGMSLAISPAPI